MSKAEHRMTPKEWYRCMDAGITAVRRPYLLPMSRNEGFQRITIYHIPSFFDCTGWTVYELPVSKSYVLQSVTWRQYADSKRIEDFEVGRVSSDAASQPTLVGATKPLDASWFQAQLSKLASMRVPLVCKGHLMCIADGESFGVHAQQEFDVEWQCDGPEEWGDLVRWTHECIDHFRQLIPTGR